MGIALLPNGRQQFFDANGDPLSDGKVYFYKPGTSDPKTTWKDPDRSEEHLNPVSLDDDGNAVIWGSGTYRQLVTTSGDVTVWDELTRASDGILTANSLEEMRELSISDLAEDQIIYLTGYAEAGGPGAGFFRVVVTSGPMDDNGGTIIMSSATGYWFVRQYVAPVDPRWWGAGATGDDTDAYRAALTWAAQQGQELRVPAGTAHLALTFDASEVMDFKGLTISGENSQTSIIKPYGVIPDTDEDDAPLAALKIINCRGLIMRDLQLDGGLGDPDNHCFRVCHFENNDYMMWERVYAHSSYYDEGDDQPHGQNFTVTDSVGGRIVDCILAGIPVTEPAGNPTSSAEPISRELLVIGENCHDWVVSRTTFKRTGDTLALVAAPDGPVADFVQIPTHIRFSDCYFEQASCGFVASYGFRSIGGKYVTLGNNTFDTGGKLNIAIDASPRDPADGLDAEGFVTSGNRILGACVTGMNVVDGVEAQFKGDLIDGRYPVGSSLALSSLAYSGGTVTGITTAPHGWTLGTVIPITISGAAPVGYNGYFLATVTDTNKFTYALASNPGSGTSPGFVTRNAFGRRGAALFGGAETTSGALIRQRAVASDLKIFNTSNSGLTQRHLVTRDLTVKDWNLASQVFAITSATWSGGVATVTTTANHGLSQMANVTISGFTPVGYNGNFRATITGTNTFTYPLTTNPGATSVVGAYALDYAAIEFSGDGFGNEVVIGAEATLTNSPTGSGSFMARANSSDPILSLSVRGCEGDSNVAFDRLQTADVAAGSQYTPQALNNFPRSQIDPNLTISGSNATLDLRGWGTFVSIRLTASAATNLDVILADPGAELNIEFRTNLITIRNHSVSSGNILTSNALPIAGASGRVVKVRTHDSASAAAFQFQTCT